MVREFSSRYYQRIQNGCSQIISASHQRCNQPYTASDMVDSICLWPYLYDITLLAQDFKETDRSYDSSGVNRYYETVLISNTLKSHVGKLCNSFESYD